ncbi:MAG: RNA polymerase sigma factor [Armatimonadota bacterium]
MSQDGRRMQSCATAGQETRSRPTRSALVERARLGDVGAFDELYREHRDRVYTLCVDLCGDREMAEDALQETFVKAWRGVRGFRGRSSFATWVHRIAVNACRDAARRSPHPPAPSPRLARGSDEDGGDSFGRDALVEQVRATLAGMKPSFRAALVLRYTLGLSYEEIGETLGWSMAKVKVTIHRAKAAFREAYVGGDEG